MRLAHTDKAKLRTPSRWAVASPTPELADAPVAALTALGAPELGGCDVLVHGERQHPALPDAPRGRRFYVPLELLVMLTFAAGLAWVCFSLRLSRHSIASLAQDMPMTAAIVLDAGLALIPGY